MIKRDAAVVARQVSAIYKRIPEEIRARGSRFVVLALDSAPNFFFRPRADASGGEMGGFATPVLINYLAYSSQILISALRARQGLLCAVRSLV